MRIHPNEGGENGMSSLWHPKYYELRGAIKINGNKKNSVFYFR
jgi:hypothetical protein